MRMEQSNFKQLQQQMLIENENQFGQEIREKYGEDIIWQSNGKFRNLTEEQFQAANNLERQFFARLREALEENDPACDVAQEAAELHKRWLSFFWPKYTKEAHVALAQMYASDERFTAYYDEHVEPGATKFLCDVITIYSTLNV